MSNLPLDMSRSATALTMLIALACVGCKARELGANYSDTQSETVDNTWVTAVESCWPAVAHQGYSTEGVKHYLADPLHFRAAFTVYAPLSDETLRSTVAAPVTNAPMPDISVLMHTRSPILSRAQAATGSVANPATVPGADSLCTIQPGLPVGFR